MKNKFSKIFCFFIIFNVFALGANISVPLSQFMANRKVQGIAGKIEFQLEPIYYYLKGVTLANNEYTDSFFPLFLVLDRKEGRLIVSPTDTRWKIEIRKDENLVIYSSNGLIVKIAYLVKNDHLDIVAEIVQEGDWRLISIEGTFLKREVPIESKEDYIIDGSGWLVSPDIQNSKNKRWITNVDNLIGGATTASFAAWKEKDRIVYLKPLTFSSWLGWDAIPNGKTTTFLLKGGLFFRPSETKIFETKLCHERLAMRIETIGDINNDKIVDWVDAGIAYRERYIKQNSKKNPVMRDSFKVYYQIVNNYEKLLTFLPKIDYASGIWWFKGLMAPAFEVDSESHPYIIKFNEKFGSQQQLEIFKKVMRQNNHYVGIYYGNDYITFTEKDNWTDEFIKRDPNNQPYKYYYTYGIQKYYKDNLRAVLTGKIFEHYKKIIDTCLLKKGDPVMLDTFTAFAREGYHPDFPATVELEMDAKRKVAEFFRNEGLIIAGEGTIEGTQDIIDYGAYSIKPYKIIKERLWECKDGIRYVPILPVIFGGASYYGAGWYELRNPYPNWAVGLVYGVCYWDWLPQGPESAWTRFARYYFNQNIFWAQIADAKVIDIDQQESIFTIKYDNGCILKADIAKNTWTLKKENVVYDGFTPFNDRGYMAVLKQDTFEIKIPGKHCLEISEQQPFSDKIEFTYVENSDNTTTIKGRFGHIKWQVGIIQIKDGKEVIVPIEVDPVLVIKKTK